MEEHAQSSPAEQQRIEFLIKRDGHAPTREWVERTLKMYVAAVEDSASFASSSHYRPLFEASIQTFNKWLADNP